MLAENYGESSNDEALARKRQRPCLLGLGLNLGDARAQAGGRSGLYGVPRGSDFGDLGAFKPLSPKTLLTVHSTTKRRS